ncbi:MAG: hypothetical protein WBA22_08130 [Candidatus Methanofastidiosia archaeon]
MKINPKLKTNINEAPRELIREILKMDRLQYLSIIQQKDPMTSLKITNEILALKEGIKPEKVKVKDTKKHNPNINKRLLDLTNLGILEDHEGEYSLSPVGTLLIDGLRRLESNIDIIRKHEWFFKAHDYSVIPSHQLHEIHKIQFAKQCEDEFEYRKELVESTQRTEHQICIVSERLHDIPSWIIEEMKNGAITLKYVYQFKKPLELNFNDSEERELWQDLTQEPSPGIEFRYSTLENRNPIGIRIIDRKWAGFNLFEFAENKLNRRRSFYGTDGEFIVWVEDLFSHIWNSSQILQIEDS